MVVGLIDKIIVFVLRVAEEVVSVVGSVIVIVGSICKFIRVDVLLALAVSKVMETIAVVSLALALVIGLLFTVT